MCGTARQARTGSEIWLLENGRAVAVEVHTGLDDDTYTQIASGGVPEGAQVIVSEQNQGKAASSANPAPRFP